MKGFFKFILAILIFAAGCFAGSVLTTQKIKEGQDDSSSTPGLYFPSSGNGQVNNNDIENVDFIYASDYRSVTIRFVAASNISNLQVKVEMSNSDGFLLDSQVITVGNVIKGQQYLVTASLPDNAVTKDEVIKTVELNVYGGTLEN